MANKKKGQVDPDFEEFKDAVQNNLEKGIAENDGSKSAEQLAAENERATESKLPVTGASGNAPALAAEEASKRGETTPPGVQRNVTHSAGHETDVPNAPGNRAQDNTTDEAKVRKTRTR